MLVENGYQDFICYDHLDIGRRFNQLPNFPDKCVVCRGPLQNSRLNGISPFGRKWIAGDALSSVEIVLIKCQKCGWWCAEEFGHWYEMNSPWPAFAYVALGVLKKWDIADKDVPVDALKAYIRSHAKSAAFKTLNASSFERLIADCLRVEYAPCEVRHVGVSGGAGDRGIDLYLVKDEEEWLVQVKRRVNDAPEPIESIRALNGVLLRDARHKGMLVTSARRFSRNAVRETAIASTGPYYVQLVNGEQVVEMIEGQQATPWEKIFSRVATQESPWKKLTEDEPYVVQAELLPPELYSLFFQISDGDISKLAERPYTSFAEVWREMIENDRIKERVRGVANWMGDLTTVATGSVSGCNDLIRLQATSLQNVMLENAKLGRSVLAFKSQAERILEHANLKR